MLSELAIGHAPVNRKAEELLEFTPIFLADLAETTADAVIQSVALMRRK
ncbi:hypothetical protein CUJ84_pRLN3000139 (plasmid) [Rhizobium leguminosarum]|uniref:Uncharacterized protein n=1 Tax=Rhizobium leguminosarum TaxID=384 RepID=A0A2K9ZG98_RHILE|nr:hypothetical protein CUJ84_pRLN3000139 [Rhizobium leguminosarum]